MRRRFGIATGAFPENVRDSWPDAVLWAQREGWAVLELTAVSEALLDDLLAFFGERGERLGGFERVSVHAPMVLRSSPERVLEKLLVLPAVCEVVVHPDVCAGEPGFNRLGRRVVVENMDVQKRDGRTVDELTAVFEELPEAGFCLDVAHVWTLDPSLRLGHDLLDAFGDRLRQLHVSGIEPDGTHRPTTKGDLELYEPVLDRCERVPWLLETELAD